MKQKKIALVFAVAFGVTALAQTIPGTAQSPQGTDRSTMRQSSPSQASPSQAPDMSNPNTRNKKLKGCVQSLGGKYVLQDKRGKEISLGGSQDLTAHVGHTVTVHGNYANGSVASAAASSVASNGGISGDQFLVSKVDMVSETCMMDKGKNSSKDQGDSGKPSPYRK